MKRVLALLLVVAMFIACVAVGIAANRTAPAEAAEPILPSPPVTVTIRPPTVTLPPPPPITIRLPGVETTIRVPVPAETVRIPGPTVTVTREVIEPGETVTETVPGPTRTVTVAPEPSALPSSQPSPASPTETITVTNSAPTPRQTPSDDGTVVASDPVISLPEIDSLPEAVGYSLLSLLIILLLTVGGMVYGFHRGRKSKEKEDTDWMRSLLERVSSRR